MLSLPYQSTVTIIDSETQKPRKGPKWKITWIVTTEETKKTGKTKDISVDLSKSKPKKARVTVVATLKEVGWIKRTIIIDMSDSEFPSTLVLIPLLCIAHAYFGSSISYFLCLPLNCVLSLDIEFVLITDFVLY